MQAKLYNLSVPPSHSVDVGQWDSYRQGQDSARLNHETPNLKLLANNVFLRDSRWDNNGTLQKQTVPAHKTVMGQPGNERFEERAAILEFDGRLSRADAEAQAAKELQQRMGANYNG